MQLTEPGRARSAAIVVGWFALLVGLATPSPLQAEAMRARLVWRRPADSMCPSAALLEGDVEQLLGRRVFSSEASVDMRIEGDIEETATGVHVHIHTHAPDGSLLGSRELHAEAGECAALRQPLALVLSLLVERDVPADPTPRAAHEWGIGVQGAGLSGELPRITPGVGTALGVSLVPRLALQTGASYWFPVSIETSEGLGAKFQAVSAELALCPHLSPPVHRLVLSLCAGAQLGALLAAPRGLDGPDRQARLLALATLELRLAARLGSQLMLWGSVGPTLALSRPTFYLTHTDGSTLDVHRPDQFGVLFRLTLLFWPRAS